MKTIKIIFVITILSFIQSNAQFTDNIESYPLGRYIGNHWDSWDGTIGKAPIVSDDFAHSGEKSMLIPENFAVDCLLKLGDKNSGNWHLEWWMYIPNDATGYFQILGHLPPNTEFFNCNNNFNYNSINENQYHCRSPIGDFDYNFIHENAYPVNQWFKVEINVNMSNGMDNATIQVIVNDNIVIPEGTAYGGSTSAPFTYFAAIDFLSISNAHRIYLDDILFQEIPLSTADYLNQKIKIYPNPAETSIIINFNDLEIISLDLFNVLGSKIKNFKEHDKKLDLSTINSGIYFLNINTNKGKLVKKIVIEK